MQPEDAIDVTREALWTAMTVAGPLLAIVLVVGIVMGLLQAVTQIQEPSLSFVARVAAMLAALSFCLPWIFEQLVEYSRTLISSIPQMIVGG